MIRRCRLRLVLGPGVIKFGLAAPARTPNMSCPGIIMYTPLYPFLGITPGQLIFGARAGAARPNLITPGESCESKLICLGSIMISAVYYSVIVMWCNSAVYVLQPMWCCLCGAGYLCAVYVLPMRCICVVVSVRCPPRASAHSQGSLMLDLSWGTFIIAPGPPNLFIPRGFLSGGQGYV